MPYSAASSFISSAIHRADVVTPVARTEPDVNTADYTRHVELLKKRLPSPDFTIVVQPPFVVIGDEPAEAVKEHSERTVKWAVDKLKQDYFSKDPNEILDIWLFKDAPSYERNALALFGDKPSTPYGYYSSRHKVSDHEHLDRRRHAGA